MYEVRIYKEGVSTEDGPVLTVKATKTLAAAASAFSLLTEEFTQRKGYFISMHRITKKGVNKGEIRLLCLEGRDVLAPSSWYAMPAI